jgi:alginate biosynthesis protein AlgX
MNRAIRMAAWVALSCLILGPAAQAQTASDFACKELEVSTTLPALEGKDGVFFRTFADIRMQDPMDDRIIALMGKLSQVLAENGTTLIYVSVPTKAQAMSSFLPERAADYGFDPAIADAVYSDITNRLTAAGIIAPDIMTALKNTPADERAFLGADFHWTSSGARVAAIEIARAIRAHPAYADLPKTQFSTTEIGSQVAFSGMRRSLQTFCVDALPPTETMAYKTEAVAVSDGAGAGLDIFASAQESLPAVLVGTSFSDSPINNFVGFLTQYAEIEIVNYAITGGNQYGAITSYMTSDDFKAQRPRFLIWENPIYTNLAQFGTAPMEELIAAAGNTCTVLLQTTRVDDHTVTASLAGLKIGPHDALFAAYGAEGSRRAEFSIETADGIVRTAKVERSARLRGTGNFFVGMGAYHHPAYANLNVRFDLPVTDKTSLTFCPTRRGDAP